MTKVIVQLLTFQSLSLMLVLRIGCRIFNMFECNAESFAKDTSKTLKVEKPLKSFEYAERKAFTKSLENLTMPNNIRRGLQAQKTLFSKEFRIPLRKVFFEPEDPFEYCSAL